MHQRFPAGRRAGRSADHLVGRAWSLACAALLLAGAAAAQTATFVHGDGTTHHYRAVAAPKGITWEAANRAAAAAGGYLATIHSVEENDAVHALITDPRFWSVGSSRADGPWLGGHQFGGSKEPEQGWAWAENDAPMTYRNWSPGEPDDKRNADRIHFGGTAITKGWADARHNRKMRGYVVELSGPTVPRTVGLDLRRRGTESGYTLFGIWRNQNTYLIGPRGRVVNKWVSAFNPGMSSYLLPGGDMIRCGSTNNEYFPSGGAGGVVERFSWGGKLLWQFKHSDAKQCQHHDISVMPNGNVLMIAWEAKSQADAVAAGRDSSQVGFMGLWPEKIVEVKPKGSTGGDVVWEWHVWDHLVQDHDSKVANYGKVSDHPELIDINFPKEDAAADWLHANAIDYNADLDQIVISLRAISEIWIIDHGTTTAQAKGHSGGRRGKGGDLLYRWGNPQAYRAGTAADRQLFVQHDAHWIRKGRPGAGNLLVFNNGEGRPSGDASSVDELVPPIDKKGNYVRAAGKAFGPRRPKWVWMADTPTDFYSAFVSSAQRLGSGNTLIGGGATGNIFEVDRRGRKVWEYVVPLQPSGIFVQGTVPPDRSNVFFRGVHYSGCGPELRGRTLRPGEPIEAHGSVLLVDGSTVDRRVRPGADVGFSLRAAGEAGKPYLVGTSFTKGLLPVDLRFARMGVDPVLVASFTGAAPQVFRGYTGKLDSGGRANAVLRLPRDHRLIGTRFYTTFVVADGKAPSGISFISNTVAVVVE